jgi:diguanylate cyclase (GGDEF)-like protein
MLADLDDFKPINHAHGYAAGDEVLRWVAHRLAVAIRPADTLARLSGDEFVVVAPNVADDADALALGDRLRAAMAVTGDDVPPIAGMSVSVGIACGGSDADASELLSHADTALYLAKASGRDRCRLFDHALRSHVARRIEIDQQLRRVLDDGSLDVHFQPIVTTHTRTPAGVEALIRVATADGVDIHPHELLRAATDNGLLRRVEGAVLEASCAQVASWDDIDPTLTLAVNLTERQFRDHELVRTVNHALRASGLAPHRLCIEINEPAVADDTNAARGTISRLRALGVRVAVDEFCGSQVLMRLLPGLGIEQIKLDRSLVLALDTDWGRMVVSSSVDKAMELGLRVGAVGVETEEQLEFLTAAGCVFAQGYLFERPLPALGTRAALTRLALR